MIIYPAIDLSAGKVVRLIKGNFERKTIYSNDPELQVNKFESYGAKWIHIVDLDGALSGKNENKKAIKEVLQSTNCKIQLGGGIRTLKNIEDWINLGVSRVIIGTAAIKNKRFISDAVKYFPERISVGLDLLKEKVAIKGWTEVVANKKADYFFQKFSDLGVASIIYTDISKDGLLKGPNLRQIIYYKNLIKVPLIASGGISSFDDIIKLKKSNIYGTIIGKAIYEKKIDLKKVFGLA